MEKNQRIDFPSLFDTIGSFLGQLIELQENLKRLSPDELRAEVDKLFKASSPSAADEAFDAWKQIVDTIYFGSESRGCLTINTRMK